MKNFMYKFLDIDQSKMKIDINHRKTNFLMILMKSDVRNSFFEPKQSHNFTIFRHFTTFLIVSGPILIIKSMN